jgi:hypothetical protein
MMVVDVEILVDVLLVPATASFHCVFSIFVGGLILCSAANYW